MSFIGTAILGSAAIGAGASIYGSMQQQKGLQNAIATEQNMVSPFAASGQQAGKTLMDLLTPGANQTQTLSQIPGYQFMQDWAQKQAAAQGTYRGLGGNTMAAGAQYGQGLAQSAFGSIVDPLTRIFGQGATSAGTAAQAIGGAQAGIGTAQASGVTGAAGALGQGIGSLTNLSILSALSGNRGMFGGNQPMNIGQPTGGLY